MSRILITGAAGFLGSFLCDRLLADGHEVIGMGNNVSDRTDNLEEAFYYENFSFYNHDITEFIHVSGELDAVLHLASLASPMFYRNYPIKTLKVGALGTHKTLGLAKKKGPRMRLDDGRVIPNFMRQALTGEELTVYGDGEQTRSFCYVSDLIDGLVTLWESDVEEPVNIGNSDERTINELANEVLEVTGSDSGITYEELPPQNPQVRRPDITKAHKELEWVPQVPLREGLEQSLS